MRIIGPPVIGSFLAIVFATSWAAFAEDSVSESSSKLEVKSGAVDPTSVVFTPPPPPKPAPQVVAEAATVVQKSTYRLTLLRGEPSTLPDLPGPRKKVDRVALAPVPVPPPRPSFLLGLSVTIYDRELSHLRWRDPETKEELEAWCGWDWGLVAPMQEVSSNQVVYNLFYAPFHVDTSKRDALGRLVSIPDHPPVGDDEFVLTKGDETSSSGKGFLEAVQSFCIENRTTLEQLRAAREQYRIDAEAWRKANPTEPRDHTIVLRPHRGSRYLQGRTLEASTSETTTEEVGQ